MELPVDIISAAERFLLAKSAAVAQTAAIPSRGPFIGEEVVAAAGNATTTVNGRAALAERAADRRNNGAYLLTSYCCSTKTSDQGSIGRASSKRPFASAWNNSVFVRRASCRNAAVCSRVGVAGDPMSRQAAMA